MKYKVGQINIGSTSGDLIYDVVKREDVNNIVEFGTWNGFGSTTCVIKSIIDSGVEKNFVSIELYPDMYEEAKENLTEKNLIKYVKLLNGRVIDVNDVFWFDHNLVTDTMKKGQDQHGISALHSQLWYYKDLDFLKKAKNILDELPESIDFLILDGGEYSTYPEWIKLKDRVKIVALDDTKSLKCEKIRKEIIESNEYEAVYDNQDYRFGFSIFERKI